MVDNFFAFQGVDMWNICFREYNQDGALTELVSCRSKRISSKWKTIKSFLEACKPDFIREVQFCKNGKQMPSLVSNGSGTKFEKPIVAMLPLFDFARDKGINV